MVSPDAVDMRAPDGSFDLVSRIQEEYGGKLGNKRTTVRVSVYPILPEDLELDLDHLPDDFREGLAMVIDELSALKAAESLPGEKFAYVEVLYDPMNETNQGRREFVLSDQLRVINLRNNDLRYPRNPVTPPPIDQIFNEIKKAARKQPTLRTFD